jgi:hypothetical protein
MTAKPRANHVKAEAGKSPVTNFGENVSNHKFYWDLAYVRKRLLTAIVILFASFRLSSRKSANPTGRISLNLMAFTKEMV